MKKRQLFLLSFSLNRLLIANYQEECCLDSYETSLTPICEAYTPAFNNLPTEWGVFLTGDFLYWDCYESNLSYAAQVETVSNSIVGTPVYLNEATVPVSYKHFNTEWEPKFRIGFGWIIKDGWDVFANWTYYTNQKHASSTEAPFSTQFPPQGTFGFDLPWVDNALLMVPDTVFQSISAKWRLRLNEIDLELGRKYFLSPRLVMRPYAGVRGAWTETKFSVAGFSQQAIGPAGGSLGLYMPGNFNITTSDIFKNHNWGVGLLAGFEPIFYLTKSLGLYAKAGAALLWGKFKGTTNRVYTLTGTPDGESPLSYISTTPTAKNDVFGTQPIFDLALGICLQNSCWDDRYGWAFNLGWENHVWFRHNERLKVFTPVLADNPGSANFDAFSEANLNYEEMNANLFIGGLVLRVNITF